MQELQTYSILLMQNYLRGGECSRNQESMYNSDQIITNLLIEINLASCSKILGGLSEVAKEAMASSTEFVRGRIVRVQFNSSRIHN